MIQAMTLTMTRDEAIPLVQAAEAVLALDWENPGPLLHAVNLLKAKFKITIQEARGE